MDGNEHAHPESTGATGPLDCAATQELSTPYLDGRLPAADRRAVQEHLRSCPDCLAVYRRLKRLTKAVQALPLVEPRSDLARRVRRTLSRRRDGTLASLGQAQGPADSAERRSLRSQLRTEGRRRVVRLVAAACVFAVATTSVAWLVGYRMGQRSERDAQRIALNGVTEDWTDSIDSVTPDRERPAADREPLARGALVPDALRGDRASATDVAFDSWRRDGFEPARFQRAVRGIVGDLAVLDRVPREQRRPLLQAQIEHFDLASQADRFRTLAPATPSDGAESAELVAALTTLCRFIDGLEDALTRDPAEFDAAVATVRAAADETGIVELIAKMPSAPSDSSPRLGGNELLIQVVDRVAPELDGTERDALVNTLRLKDSWVDHRLDEPVRLAYAGTLHDVAGSLDAPASFVVASALVEAGLAETARPLLDALVTETTTEEYEDENGRTVLRTTTTTLRTKIVRRLLQSPRR